MGDRSSLWGLRFETNYHCSFIFYFLAWFCVSLILFSPGLPVLGGGRSVYHFLKFIWKRRSKPRSVWHRKLSFGREQSVTVIAILVLFFCFFLNIKLEYIWEYLFCTVAILKILYKLLNSCLLGSNYFLIYWGTRIFISIFFFFWIG